ncbi:30265_t:CDS:1, partial [Racocetra persica]
EVGRSLGFHDRLSDTLIGVFRDFEAAPISPANCSANFFISGLLSKSTSPSVSSSSSITMSSSFSQCSLQVSQRSPL